MIQPVITGTGSCIPEKVITNESFHSTPFFSKNGEKLYQSGKAIVDKFSSITGIKERRYARTDQNASDLGSIAAAEAIQCAGIDKDSLDYIIVAHNFGDVSFETNRTSQVPTLASRIKSHLNISNPDCVAYDLPFGCPGWIEGLIQAGYFIRSGDAKKCLVVGAETLSRVLDPYDRDSMIFSDGAGAAVLEANDSADRGMIAHKTQTHAVDFIPVLNMDVSCSPYANDRQDLFLKMEGRKVYEFAVTHVPLLVKNLLDRSGIDIARISKVLIHQANEKMDKAILGRLFQMFGQTPVRHNIMPMTIEFLGNSSVATVPTLLDLLLKGKLSGHSVTTGEFILLVSVGAGMNINAILYRI